MPLFNSPIPCMPSALCRLLVLFSFLFSLTSQCSSPHLPPAPQLYRAVLQRSGRSSPPAATSQVRRRCRCTGQHSPAQDPHRSRRRPRPSHLTSLTYFSRNKPRTTRKSDDGNAARPRRGLEAPLQTGPGGRSLDLSGPFSTVSVGLAQSEPPGRPLCRRKNGWGYAHFDPGIRINVDL